MLTRLRARRFRQMFERPLILTSGAPPPHGDRFHGIPGARPPFAPRAVWCRHLHDDGLGAAHELMAACAWSGSQFASAPTQHSSRSCCPASLDGLPPRANHVLRLQMTAGTSADHPTPHDEIADTTRPARDGHDAFRRTRRGRTPANRTSEAISESKRQRSEHDAPALRRPRIAGILVIVVTIVVVVIARCGEKLVSNPSGTT